jgi:hypothetical protein
MELLLNIRRNPFTLKKKNNKFLWFSTSDCPMVSSHFWPLYYLSFDFRLLIANWYLHTFGHCVVCPLIFDFWLPIGIFKCEDTNGQSEVENQRTDNTMAKSVKISMGNQKSKIKGQTNCVVCPLIFDFWLPIGIFTLLAIVLSVLWFSTSDCPLISSHFWLLCCLSFDFRLLIGSRKSKDRQHNGQKCEDINGQSEVENQRTDNTIAKSVNSDDQWFLQNEQLPLSSGAARIVW